MINAQTDSSKGVLGIDAGGTFTDLALVGMADSGVIAAVKTPTDHRDMVTTIENGLKKILLQVKPEQIQAVNLATTHATNAIVEGKIRRCGLIVIGYDRDSVELYRGQNKFGTDLVYQVDGGHAPNGSEQTPFDEEAFSAACDRLLPDVESVAISSFFSVRNPSHELRGREILLSKRGDIYVTCGHEIASDLDALKRATTAVLNAGLIPIVMSLLDSVESVCRSLGLYAPITIVRGDGSLVSAGWARTHPIETVLSGPAASAIGAGFLSNLWRDEGASYVVDIGGTTTDIIYLDESGKPILGTEGTTVGGHKTLVKSIDIYTFGLGGDSRVIFDKEHKIIIGPRRVKPICSAAVDYPRVKELLRGLAACNVCREPLIVFREKGRGLNGISDFASKVLDQLADGPNLASYLVERERSPHMALLQIEEMEGRGLVSYAGFTPTDALHVLGLMDKWDSEASRLAAQIWCPDRDETVEGLSGRICAEFSKLAARNVLRKGLIKEIGELSPNGEGERMIDATLSAGSRRRNFVSLNIDAALIGLGAPSWAFIGKAADLLGARSAIPQNSEVGGAIGAAVGTFSFIYVVLITPLPNGCHRAHLPAGIEDFESLDTAVEKSDALMRDWVVERARSAGAKKPTVCLSREDEEAWIAGGTLKVHLWTHLHYEVTDE